MQNSVLPGENAIGPTIEIICTSHWPLVHTDYNAESCYDRIMLNMTSLASHAHGLNKSVPIINVTTLQEANLSSKLN